MTRARNKSLQDEAAWQVYQLNAKTGVDNRSKQRNVTHAFILVIVIVLALGGLMIWAAWL
jgi:hypothetical protein